MKKTIYILFLSALALSCTKKGPYNDPIPKHDNFTIQSQQVDEERVINVWTPPEFRNGDTPLPVLYMPDGGINEDFPHIANTLAKLVDNNSIPPLMLVGIENTERGRDLTGFSEVEEHAKYNPLTDGAKNFRAFITDELMPEINRKYKTTAKKGLLGESLAGLFVMETFFLKPEAFDFYIAMDPSLWWNDNYLVENADTLLQNLPERKTRLWFAGSSATDISKYTRQFAERLKNDTPPSLTWTYSDEPEEEHHTIFRATKEKAFIWALNDQ